jgi:membrane protease YdiL (CAAX protease family)
MSSAPSRTNGFAMAVVVEGGLALAALGIAAFFRIPLRDQLVSSTIPWHLRVVRGVLVTIPMLAAFWWLVHSSRTTLRELRQQVEWLIREMFPTSSIPQFALVAILAGVGEELLFRGALQTLIGRWTTPVFGLVITSVLFGLAHALSKLYFVFATVIGLCFGWLVLRYNDLVTPMVAHSLYDFIALVYLSKRTTSAGRSSSPGNVTGSAQDSNSNSDEPSDH